MACLSWQGVPGRERARRHGCRCGHHVESLEHPFFCAMNRHACHDRECLDVNARAGMIADAATIQELLYEVLPPVLRGGPGASVAALARPWAHARGPLRRHRAVVGQVGCMWH